MMDGRVSPLTRPSFFHGFFTTRKPIQIRAAENGIFDRLLKGRDDRGMIPRSFYLLARFDAPHRIISHRDRRGRVSVDPIAVRNTSPA
jgi:hypothetical protein